MVNVITPSQRVNVTYNVATGVETSTHPQSGLEQLAQQVGLTDTMHQVNQESEYNDQQDRVDAGLIDAPEYYADEQYEEEPIDVSLGGVPSEEKQPQKRRKAKKRDKRFDEFTQKYAASMEENKALREQNRQSEVYRLQLEKALLESEQKQLGGQIKDLSKVMKDALDEQDNETFVEANRLLTQVTNDRDKTSQTLRRYNEEIQNVDNYEDDYSNDETQLESYAYEKLLELSDVKELNSEPYQDWIATHPYYNPYDYENFDGDLADEVLGIKKEFNKWLKYRNEGDFIGSDDYYHELDRLIDARIEGTSLDEQEYYEEPQYQQPGYSNRGYSNQNEESDYMANQPIHRVAIDQYGQGGRVAPVNRSGYNRGGTQNLPELTRLEEQLALSMPMVDEKSRPLSDREKIQVYKEGKAGMR